MGGRAIKFASLLAAFAAWAGVAHAAGEKCDIGKLAELPVTMAGLKPLVTVKLNGVDTTFIADSGAFFSTMDRDTVQRLKLPSEMGPMGMYVRGLGGTDSRVDVATVHSFGLAGIDIPNVRFLAVPGAGFGTAGLLGQNVLSVFDTEYDLGNAMIRLMKPSPGCAHAMVAYWAGSQPVGVVDLEPITPQSPHLRGKATLNGQPIRVTFDTGSSVSYVKLSTAERLGFRPDAAGVQAAGVTGGIGYRQLETWIAPFDELDVGGEKIKHTRLRIIDMSSESADVLLGADFFLSHRVYVSKQQRRLYFTYNGGPVFQLDKRPPTIASAASAAGEYADAPVDAAGFTRRGEASMSRHDFAAALADFTKASELDPKDPQHFRDRARAHLALRQPVLAMADFDEALKLKPDDAASLIGRGALYLGSRDLGHAKTDFDAALKVEPARALAISGLYEAAGRYDEAIAGYDGWIAAHPNGEHISTIFNARCWTRTVANRELDKALADCDEALRRGPKVAAFYDSRGLAHLRRGELDLAIADYDQALKMQPKLAWSLYGRGLAEVAKGQKTPGDTDMAAGVALQPNLPTLAKRYGLSPSGATQATATAAKTGAGAQ